MGIDIPGESYLRTTDISHDTVGSGNNTFYIDSTFHESYFFSWHTTVASIDVSQIFHTNDARLYSMAFGYGLQLGCGINNYFNASYNSFVIENITYPPHSQTSGYFSNMSDFHSELEITHCAPVFFGRVYFPISAQLRFSRKNNGFNHLAATAELRTGIDVQQVTNIGVMARPFYFQSFGLRYYFDQNVTKK